MSHDLFSDMHSTCFDTFGHAALVRPADADPIETTAVLDENVEIQREGAYTVETVSTMDLPTPDVGKLTRYTPIEFEGYEYKTDGILEGGTDQHVTRYIVLKGDPLP